MGENSTDIHTHEHPQHRIRSFSRRGSRLIRPHMEAVEKWGSTFYLPYIPGDLPGTLAAHQHIDLDAVFGRKAPLVVEIGPGSGEQLIAFALAHPDMNVLAVEAWEPGAARCLSRIVREKVTNVRILPADAAQALPVLFGLTGAGFDHEGKVDGTVDATHPNSANPRAHMLWTFFPDPWRKTRHHKRRLVNDAFARTAAGVIEKGGTWRLATDWDNYAWTMRTVIEESVFFENPYLGQRPDPNDEEGDRGGFAPRWEGRILTRFEERGIQAGRTIHDVCARRK